VVIESLDFEQDPAGWAVGGDAADGHWTRGEPVECTSGSMPKRFLSFPTSDFDGSGACFLTDNSAVSPLGIRDCDSDVDAGATVLTSTSYDLSRLESATLSYARLLDTTSTNDGAAEDPFVVEVDDGSGWVVIETVGPTALDERPEIAGQWSHSVCDLGSLVGLTGAVRVRFIARDLDTESVVEAALDAFRIEGVRCDFTPPCLGDGTGDGVVDFADLTSTLRHWGAVYEATPEASGPGDSDFDGVVDFGDISAALDAWLTACP